MNSSKRKQYIVGVILTFFLMGLFSGCSASVAGLLDDLRGTDPGQDILTTEYSDYYYCQLGSAEQKVYRSLLRGCEKRKTKITFRPLSTDSFYKTQGALMYDHPEFFWIRSFTISVMGESVVSVSYPFEESYETQFRQVEESARTIVSGAPSDDGEYEVLKYFYDTIIETVDYDASSENGQDLRSVFLDHRSVCAGYSKAFQYLCNMAGIPCITVRGKDADGSTHAWNMVKINGENYWVDTTWGDPVFAQETELDNTNYNYFCVTDEELFRTHTLSRSVEMDQKIIEDAFEFPSCTDDSYNYYKRLGAFFETYDRTAVAEYLKTSLQNGKMLGLELKFGSGEAYQNAMYDLFTGNRAIETILLNYRSIGVRSISYSYGFMDECYYIVLNVHYSAG